MVGFALAVKELVNSSVCVSPVLSEVIKWVIVTVSVATLAYLMLFVNRMQIENLRINAEVNLKNGLFSEVMKKDYALLSAYKGGDVLNRVVNDSAIVARGYASVLPLFVSMLTKVLLAVGVLLVLQPLFTLILLLCGLIIAFLSFFFRKITKKLHRATRESESDVMSYYSERMNNLLAVKVFSAEDKVAEKGEEIVDSYRKCAKKQRMVSAALNSGIGYCFILFYVLTVVYGAVGLYRGAEGVDFGMITAMVQLVSQLQTPFANFSAIFSVYYEMLASAERLMELERLTDEKPPKKDLSVLRFYDELKSITAENLTFSYNDRESVFADADFEIKKGDGVMIKGISGIGKSTLLKLMLGVYPEYGGSLCFVTERGRIEMGADYRAMFSFVPQGNLLFSGTIRENLCFLNENATDEEIARAMDIAAMDFVNDFPDGLETVIGENGVGLSEGQGQRVAIARAILADKPIMLLDEATSALDEETEIKILNNLSLLTEGKLTYILISHKMKTSQICNNIITISNGKIFSERKEREF